jgi:serine/threonine protein kinase
MGHGGSTATFRVVDAHRRELAMKLFDPAIAQRADVMSAIERLYGGINGLPPDMIFQILDAGYDPSTSAPFCITELSQTPSLAQMTVQRPLSQQEALEVLQSMARVIDTAHSRQIMHHALKPTNVFIAPTQGFAVRVSDFGAGISRSVVPTQEGYSLAAPWMAPEQLQNNAAPGPAADVFSAALVVFFAMTGRSYWRSCQGGAPDLGGWQREIMSARMPPSARAAELGVPLGPLLDPVLGRALAADPAERFRSVGEFAAAFASCSSSPEAAPTLAIPSMDLLPSMPSAGPGAAPSAEGGYPPAPVPTAAVAAGPGMAAPLPQRAPEASSSKLVPILIAVGAVVLIGGGAGAWLLLGRSPKPEPTGPIAIAPAQTAVPSASTSAAPPSTAPLGAGPTAPASSGSAAAAPATTEIAITCTPGPCDEIQIDEKPADAAALSSLGPGMHKVKVSKAGFVSQTETITVEPGKKLEKDFKLIAVPRAAGPTPTPGQPSTGSGQTKKCGKFIPCK